MRRVPPIRPDAPSARPGAALANAALAATLAAAAFSAPLAADDTEVFFGAVDPDMNIYPNVLFVLDTSGSMNWGDSGFEGTRLERMKEAMTTILDNSANVNVGLMRFNGSSGGGSVLYPITPLDAEVCRGANCGDVALQYQIGHMRDDVEETLSSGQINEWGAANSNVLSMGRSSSAEQAVGLRFEGIEIPQGATITSARLEFVAHQADDVASTMTIRAEDADDAARYDTDDGNLTSRGYTSASATWSPEAWRSGTSYLSSDISGIVQDVVDRSGWCGGNAIALRIDGSGQRSARSYNQSPNDAPRLKISYDAASVPAAGGCMRHTVVAGVGQGSDDAIQRDGKKKRVRTREDSLRLPRVDGRGDASTLGLRFDALAIPEGATIEEATIELEVDEVRGGDATVLIRGQAHDDAPTFKEKRNDLGKRATVSASRSWSIPGSAVDTKVKTPDIAAIVQQIVDRGGWAEGNAMVFRFDPVGKAGYRQFESFEGEQGAAPKLRVVYRVEDGTASEGGTPIAARDELKQVIGGITAYHGTPIVDAYYEAAQYYLGGSVDYGRKRGATRSRWHRVSHPESYTGGTLYRDARCTDADPDSSYCTYENIGGSPRYTSPLADSCQTNHIVFLSDGEPTSNSSAARVRALTGVDSCVLPPSKDGEAAPKQEEMCGRELADWLQDTDHNRSISRKQNISTYTIGFNTKSPFLADLARTGGGRYFDASSSEELVAVFQNILSDVLAVDTSFVAPGATVNQFNRLTHRDDIYFALFKPEQRPTWDGNLKRYRVATEKSTGELRILDVDGKNAVDPDSGFFAADAKSWWSAEVDGSTVGIGGAAGELSLDGFGGANGRQVYTYTGSASVPSGGIDLTASAHGLHESNAGITAMLLGIDAMAGTDTEKAEYRETLLRWARGVDVLDDDLDGDYTDVRPHMGDPMHARPVILNYANADGLPHTTVFVATNEGFLHAIDRSEGEEIYAFMPQELLKNLGPYFENQASTRHPYGLDGSLTVWSNDRNNNVVVDADEEAYLYTGMRRGGYSYFAIDVSERTAPRLAWKITRGDTGFEELGQTWSRAVPATVMIDKVARDVLIFGGGYDPNQDPGDSSLPLAGSVDAQGRGVYMVDAKSGERLWAGLGTLAGGDKHFPRMQYGIPSDVRVIDIDQDGLSDQFYVGDMGGQIWRFDISPHHQGGAADLVSGGVMASLAGLLPSEARRFYYEPDVALIASGGKRFLSISIGSGWRAHPLDDTIEDRFYVIRSDAVTERPDGYGKKVGVGDLAVWLPITESDLTDVTDDLDPSTSAYGWYLKLEGRGEKVLGDSITVNNQIVFTSYKPDLTTDACSTAIGAGSVYALDVFDGSAAADLDKDGEDEKEDRERTLKHGGIPPEPAPLITEDGPTILVGPEQPLPDFDFGETMRTYWLDVTHSPGAADAVRRRSTEKLELPDLPDLPDLSDLPDLPGLGAAEE